MILTKKTKCDPPFVPSHYSRGEGQDKPAIGVLVRPYA